MKLTGCRYYVIGAGFFGSVIAERIATILKEKVVVLEKRDHIGGNSNSYFDHATGIEVHQYGSHIFHTKNEDVWDYVTRFTAFNHYQHKVLSKYNNRLYPIPINLQTINSFYGVALHPFEVNAFLQNEIAKEGEIDITNFEGKTISTIGRPLYEAFIKGYTAKHWKKDPKLLPATIAGRLPVINTFEDHYFNDPYQGLPLIGYHELFKKILSNPLIDVCLSVDYFDIRERIPKDALVIYSGPLDKYYNYKHGRLSWLTLDFEKEIYSYKDYQGSAVINYADFDNRYTRSHEFRYYHPERNYSQTRTVVMKERSRLAEPDDVRYYPINSKEDQEKLRQYKAELGKEENTLFGGRLGSYQYINMDQAIAQALWIFKNKVIPWSSKHSC